MRDAGFSWFSHNPEWMAVESFDWLDRQRRKASSASKDGRSFLYFAFTLPHMPKVRAGRMRRSAMLWPLCPFVAHQPVTLSLAMFFRARTPSVMRLRVFLTRTVA